MSRKFTKRNKKGIRTRSTLLTGLEKMKMYHREANTNVKLTRTNSVESTLNNMLKWLTAVEKCPPRHYGKVWNDEKQKIVEQCRRMYIEAQSYAKSQSDVFMGFTRRTKDRGAGQDGDGRFMPLSRLRWNMATSKWDFTNQVTTGSNPYWNDEEAKKKRPVRMIRDKDGNEKSWALYHLSVQLMQQDADTEESTEKVVQPYSEWKQNHKPMKDSKGYHVGYY